MNPTLRVVALLVPSLGLAACSWIPSARAQAGYMQTEARGSAGLGPSGAAPPTNRIADDLGLDDASGKLALRGDANVGPLHATARTLAFGASGSGTLAESFGALAQGASVSSSLDVADVDVAASFDISLGPVRLSPGIGLEVMDVELAVSGATTERIGDTYTLPFLFVQGEVELGPVTGIVEVAGSDLKSGDDEMRMVDVAGLLSYELSGPVHVFAGYRFKNFEVENDTARSESLDLELRGWIVGGGVDF